MAFVANTDNMYQLVETMQTASGLIKDRLDQLDSYGAQFQATWTGPAAEAYKEQKLVWDRAAANMNNMLNVFHKQLHSISNSIVDTEHRAKGRWQSM